MVEFLKKDIFDVNGDILCHQCNCKCTMGSGIALEIKKRYPEAFEIDLKTKSDCSKLGKYSVATVCNPNTYKYIVNLYGQYSYGRDKRYTNYEAFYTSIDSLKISLIYKIMDNLTICFPYKIGCNLGGGNWNVIHTMIQEVFKDYKGKVFICKKVKT
jgi:O-acetyl-ADP-ribose deacetylase (regulator of RNase III)